MDNASKALIMAGAILISLALVGLGVYIFSISSDLQSNAGQQMDAMAAQTTNKQLSNYEGEKVRGSNLRALFNNVKTLNVQEVFPVDIEFATSNVSNVCKIAKGTDWKSGDSIRDSAYYQIVMQDDKANDGYLDTIYVKQY